MPPAWLTALAWTALAVAFASAARISYDIHRRGYPAHRHRARTIGGACVPA